MVVGVQQQQVHVSRELLRGGQHGEDGVAVRAQQGVVAGQEAAGLELGPPKGERGREVENEHDKQMSRQQQESAECRVHTLI